MSEIGREFSMSLAVPFLKRRDLEKGLTIQNGPRTASGYEAPASQRLIIYFNYAYCKSRNVDTFLPKQKDIIENEAQN